MTKSGSDNLFRLEGLEPRIMLSADPLLGALAVELDRPEVPFDAICDDFPSEVIDISSDISTQGDVSPDAYDPSEGLDDILGGLVEEQIIGWDGNTITEIDTSAAEEFVLDDPANEFAAGALESADAGILFETLDTRLQTAVYEFFGDSLDPPWADMTSLSFTPDGTLSIEIGNLSLLASTIEAGRGEVCLFVSTNGDAGEPLIISGFSMEYDGRVLPLPAVDSLIAATCLQQRLDLVTRNEGDFAHSGVTMANPWMQ